LEAKVSLSLSDLEISHIHLLSETESKMKLKIMTMALQGICVRRISNRLRMRSLDFSGES
jgi:hypothetical protein